jgi:hypothetical protein
MFDSEILLLLGTMHGYLLFYINIIMPRVYYFFDHKLQGHITYKLFQFFKIGL